MTPQDSKRFVNAEYADRLEVEVAQLRQEREQTEQFLRGRYQQILALEAARDHLRARLRELLDEWHKVRDDMEYRRDERIESDTMYETLSQHYSSSLIVMDQCAADLLAVLTEPPPQEMHEKTNENAEPRWAETDFTSTVALPHREV